MSTDADCAAAEKAEADKKAAEDAAATAAATAAAWPIGGYTSFILLVFLSVVAVLAICVDVSTMCVVHALLNHNQCVVNAVHVMLMIYSWINLIGKLPNFLSIQKPNLCRSFSNSGFAAALKPSPLAHCHERVLGRRCDSHRNDRS